MNKLHNHAQGFSALFVLLVVVLVGLIGGVGYYVYDKQKATGTDTSSTINSFAECVAAGNPVMESYPEQCAADGKTFTNPDQQANTNNGWNTEVTSGQGAFTVTFPDGFGEVIKPLDIDAFYLMGTAQPAVEAGGEITVQGVDNFGTDAASVFSIVVLEGETNPRGTAEDYTLVNGKENPIAGKKYVYIYDQDEEVGIGYQRFKGDRDYEYLFPLTDGKQLRVYYSVYGVDPRNNLETIEALIDTIRIN